MTTRTQLRSVDLNLLPVLRELLRTRNVTRTAESLNMSQSAVSEALRRLRHQFGDEILVRVGREMAPTRFAESLVSHVESALGEVEALVNPQSFDPRSVERQFIIATADSIILTLNTPHLVTRLAEEAPGITIQFVDLQRIDKRSLERGELDLVVMPRGILDETGLNSFHAYREEFVFIARRGHPAITGPLTQADIENLTSVAYRADETSDLFALLPGRTSGDQVRVPQFTLLPFIVEKSDAISLIQRHVAERFARLLDIQILEPPRTYREVEVRAYWAQIHENDLCHRWLRTRIEEVAQARTV